MACQSINNFYKMSKWVTEVCHFFFFLHVSLSCVSLLKGKNLKLTDGSIDKISFFLSLLTFSSSGRSFNSFSRNFLFNWKMPCLTCCRNDWKSRHRKPRHTKLVTKSVESLKKQQMLEFHLMMINWQRFSYVQKDLCSYNSFQFPTFWALQLSGWVGMY